MYTNTHKNLSLLNSFLSGSGLLIRVSNSSYLTSYELDGIQIQSGLYTSVQVERAFKFMLPKPYSDCQIDNDKPKKAFNSFIYDLIAQSDYQYTQALCLTQCIQYFTIKECNCSDSLIFSHFPSPSCVTDEQIKCSSTFYTKSILDNEDGGVSGFQQRVCFPLCPTECNKTEFKVKLSSVKLMGESYLDLIKQNEKLKSDFDNATQLNNNNNNDDNDDDTSIEWARKSFVRMNIFYETLSYTHSSESIKLDMLTLMAYVGGMLSLFLGLSLFSVLEVVELILHLIYMSKRTIK
jgi:hypothetical protein